MKEWLKREAREFSLLLKSVPAVLIVLFVFTVFTMNLLANKSITLPVDWLALDCGMLISWFAFWTMDMVTKHFGPKAATEISVLATLFNLFFCLVLFAGSKVPGVWGAGSEEEIVSALDSTIGGTWYVVMGSTVAFVVSAVINNACNWGIGLAFHKRPDTFFEYVLRAYVSTAIGQFADNLVFALIVSHFFFGWTMVQCVTCAATGMIAELLFEAVFAYPGYLICKRWRKNGVGAEYFNFKQRGELSNESIDNGNE